MKSVLEYKMRDDIFIVYKDGSILAEKDLVSKKYRNFKEYEDEKGETKWYVLHAEANAILKVASSTQSCRGATLYLTLSPCKDCSKLIHQAGIERLVYIDAYKDTTGLQFLEKAGVEVEQLNLD